MMLKAGINVVGSRVLVLGLAFKENCPDIRNTRVIDVIDGLREFQADVDVYDPCVNQSEAKAEYEVDMVDELPEGVYDAAVLCVAHEQFLALGIQGIKRSMKENHVLFDVKSVLPAAAVDGRL